MDINFNFVNEIITDYIIEKGLSVSRFAKLSKVSQSSISKWLNNTEKPKIKSLIKVADYCGYSLDYILGLNNENIRPKKKYTYCFISRFSELKGDKTVYKIAKESGIRQSTIWKWYQGKNPSPSNLAILADYYHCSIDYLIGRSDFK